MYTDIDKRIKRKTQPKTKQMVRILRGCYIDVFVQGQVASNGCRFSPWGNLHTVAFLTPPPPHLSRDAGTVHL